MNLYLEIGKDKIEAAITEFYVRAFADPIISHFFFGHDRLALTKKQIQFACRMLGSTERYTGKSLAIAHKNIDVRPAHFGRRQVLMKEVAIAVGIDPTLVHEWMKLEELLRPIIVK
jgi:truncated hemoglobin YjbI